jgi:hypothetical protein
VGLRQFFDENRFYIVNICFKPMINECAVWSLVLQVGVKLTPEWSGWKLSLMKRWFSCLIVKPTPIPSRASTKLVVAVWPFDLVCIKNTKYS